MMGNEMFRAIIEERIAEAVVLHRPAPPAPATPGRARVWGPRASRRREPGPGVLVTAAAIPEPRDPATTRHVDVPPAPGSVRVEVPEPRRRAGAALPPGPWMVDA